MASKAVAIWLPQVTIESILIVVSILVALGLDSWREERNDEEFVRTALSNLRLRFNVTRHALKMPRHLIRVYALSLVSTTALVILIRSMNS